MWSLVHILPPACPMYQFQNFIQFLLFFLLGTSLHGFSNTILKMLSQDLFLYLCQSTSNSAYLVQDINTIFTAFNHLLHAANLTLDSSQCDQVILMTWIFLHLLPLSYQHYYYTP